MSCMVSQNGQCIKWLSTIDLNCHFLVSEKFNLQGSIIKGNVAVYKVLHLEMLLNKVRWHVSTVKECNLIARS